MRHPQIAHILTHLTCSKNAWKQFLPLSIGGSFISRLVTFGSLNFLWIVVRPNWAECRSNFVEPSDWMNRRCTWLPPFLCSREISTHLSGTKTKKSDYCERKRWLKRKIAIGSFWNKISTFCFKASGSLFFPVKLLVIVSYSDWVIQLSYKFLFFDVSLQM